MIAQPQALDTEIDAYYGRAYYEEKWPDPDAVWALNVDLCRHYELPLFRRLWSAWPPPPGGSVVEIGCGYGVMLGVLREAGFRGQGCEPSIRAVDACRARGLDVIVGQTPGLPLPRDWYDVSVARHVIEHVADPRGFVKELVGLVRPGGVVAMVTEDAWISQYAWESTCARLRARFPRFRSSTDHTFVFRAAHLRTLLSEAGCDAVRTCSFTCRPPGESLHWRLYKGFFRVVDRLVGHGEYLVAVAHRRLTP